MSELSEHLIDLDAEPFIPEGWEVPEGCHIKGGRWKFNPKEVEFYLSKEQKKCRTIKGKKREGNRLRKRLKGKSVFNANLLDYLLKHPDLISEDWKKDEDEDIRHIFFWGTIYRDPRGYLYVRFLYWDDIWNDCWDSHFNWLGNYFNDNSPAAVRAS